MTVEEFADAVESDAFGNDDIELSFEIIAKIQAAQVC